MRSGNPLQLTSDITQTHGTAEALDIYCINANGEAIDWRGTALTAEQVQQRTDELITKGRK